MLFSYVIYDILPLLTPELDTIKDYKRDFYWHSLYHNKASELDILGSQMAGGKDLMIA